jgi:hypothetical protein
MHIPDEFNLVILEVSASVYSTEAVMRRLGFGLLLVGLVVAAHAAPPENFFVSEPNLLTIQPVRSNTGHLPPYRSSTSVVFIRSADTAPVGLGFSGTSRLPPSPIQKKKPAGHQTHAGN